MQSTEKQPLQIRSFGGMWFICQGDRVLAFASDYNFAKTRAAELERGVTIH
ncbi:hypothetical protein [Stutzerimonas kirkiae]|uniref:hypothetical protein n=1 Tax=Stutzerimonas kirkiae TaxID=2211392 RepID=UPI0013F14D49|nr:hypothetical protein [Stutzerimonas kirkiae]